MSKFHCVTVSFISAGFNGGITPYICTSLILGIFIFWCLHAKQYTVEQYMFKQLYHLWKECIKHSSVNFNSAYSAGKVGSSSRIPTLSPALLSRGGATLSTEGPVLLCALIGLPAAAQNKESLSHIGQTGTSLNVAPMLICFSHVCFGN